MNGDALHSYISIHSNKLSIHLSKGAVHIYSLPDADWLTIHTKILYKTVSITGLQQWHLNANLQHLVALTANDVLTLLWSTNKTHPTL